MASAHRLLRKAAKLAKKAQRKVAEGTNVAAGSFVRLAQLPKDDKLARCRMRGFNDVVNGQGFRPGYDLWPGQYKKTGRAMQLAYERGRMEAAIAKVAAFNNGGRVLTEWQKGEYVQGPLGRALPFKQVEQIVDECRGTVKSVK